MQTVSLTFIGGPLDGEQRHREARPDWTVIRFTEPSDSDPQLAHVYAGTRLGPEQTSVVMRYLGMTRADGEVTSD